MRGIGIDSWGVDYGLLTSDGGLVGLAYHYRDGRTDGVMERAFAIVPQSEIFRQTGIQFLQFNTLFQLLAAKERHPRLLEAAERLLMMGELFTYFLTGRAVGEFTNATTSQLYDPRLGGGPAAFSAVLGCRRRSCRRSSRRARSSASCWTR